VLYFFITNPTVVKENKKGIKILMLENNAEDAKTVKEFLLKKNLKYEFSIAGNEADYLTSLDDFRPDIILSDYPLTKLTFTGVLTDARRRRPFIPIIIVTKNVSKELAADAVSSGVDDYIAKDRLTKLPDAIFNAIQKRKLEKKHWEAEQKIIRSETNLRTIFENTSDGFLLLDQDANIIAFNSKAAKFTLLTETKEFHRGQSVYDFIEVSRKDFFGKVIEKALAGKSTQYDRLFTIADGATYWIDFSVTPVFESGRVMGICITGRDISAKKITEQERDFDRNNLQALINNTENPMWSVDRNFNLIISNAAFDRMMMSGPGSDIADGNNMLPAEFTNEKSQRFRFHYKRAFLGESFTETVYSGFNNTSWSEVSFNPIYKGNEIIGSACFSYDITWRKNAEEERRNYIKSLEKMLFKISHEVRSPIANLLGLINVSEYPDNSPEELRHIMSCIHPTVNALDAFSKELGKFIHDILTQKKMAS
jgi:PAS domain S-box-containing protein